MCAQSMIAVPLHLSMSSSSGPLAPRGQHSFPQYWNRLHDDGSASNNLASNPFGQVNSRGSQETYDSYVSKWLADTASQTRARSVPAAVQQAEKNMSNPAFGQYQMLDTRGSTAVSAAFPPCSANRPAYERPHRSMSPDMRSRPATNGKEGATDGSEDAQIASYLQIPSSINDSRGSLAEFASQVTCLFWFEDASTLSRVENSVGNPFIAALPAEANPTIGFRKWVTTLLSTTQVSQNVILLALLFIYRLKKITCNVKGKAGSEYRLLTVALMLGNKFLDDNTYTNKTWADVSGISVSEIHIMEVEFLSNMKYDLYTSLEQWQDWHVMLGRFADYFDKALRVYNSVPTPISMATSHLSGQPHLPFTPPSEQLSPPNLMASRMNPPQRQLPTPLSVYSMSSGIPQPSARGADELRSSDLRAAGSRPASRKRSLDEAMFALPHKFARIEDSTKQQSTPIPYQSAFSSPQYSLPRLPMPAGTFASSASTAPLYAPSYPTTVAPANSQLTLPAPVMAPQESAWQSGSNMAIGNMSNNVPTLPSLLTQTPQPMQSIQHTDSQNVSPTNNPFTPQQTTHSPSGLLMYRNSPYRPVRQVNTLLAPPPSLAHLHSPLQHMSQQATYYQPLSKGPIEPKQGMVPYLTPRQFQMAPMDISRQMPPLDYRQFLGHR